MLNSLRGRLIFLALLILLGYAEWLISPAPPASKKMRLADESWELPRLLDAQTGRALEILKKKSLWGKLPESGAVAPPVNLEWHILGIAMNGAERFVLVKREGQAEQSLHVNDMLPGGSKILKIEQDRICLLVNGKKRSLGIYKTGPQAL